MKIILPFLFIVCLYGCSQTDNSNQLKAQIDSLKTAVAHSYKPGFGEFMSSVQVHHSKLWFAGQNKNWPLADFEIHEIKETIEAIQNYLPERKESKSLSMIMPALDSMASVIEKKNYESFNSSYSALTDRCNECHRAVDFQFNKVIVPTSVPFTNQDFKAN